MQGTRVTADYKTRTHLMMAIKLVYQIQADKENWTRWPDMTKYYYHKVSAKSFYNIVERMAENLYGEPHTGFTLYRTFCMIDFKKFENFYSTQEWKYLLCNLNKIHSYCMDFKHAIPKSGLDKDFVFFVRTPSHFS